MFESIFDILYRFFICLVFAFMMYKRDTEPVRAFDIYLTGFLLALLLTISGGK